MVTGTTTGTSDGAEAGSEETRDGALASSPLGFEAPEERTAALQVRLTDAPGEFEAVPVTIASVGAHWCGDGDGVVDLGGEDEPPPPGGDWPDDDDDDDDEDDDDGSEMEGVWLSLVETSQEYDLLTLQDGVSAALGDVVIPAGNYDQIRLAVTEASVVIAGITYELDIPSGAQTGLKLPYDYSMEPGEEYELMLDFDAAESIRQIGDGTYKLQPVITVAYFGPPRDHGDEEGDTGL